MSKANRKEIEKVRKVLDKKNFVRGLRAWLKKKSPRAIVAKDISDNYT